MTKKIFVLTIFLVFVFAFANNDGQKTPYDSGLYASLKAQSTISWSSAGGNLEMGYLRNRMFYGFDFTFGKGDGRENENDVLNKNDKFYYYGGGFTFGGRLKPSNSFQMIVGATAGLYTGFRHQITDSVSRPGNYPNYPKYPDDYYDYNDYNYTNRVARASMSLYYGDSYYHIRSSNYCVAVGPTAKFLFGSKKIKFEFANTLLFGYPYFSYNMKAGITYAP